MGGQGQGFLGESITAPLSNGSISCTENIVAFRGNKSMSMTIASLEHLKTRDQAYTPYCTIRLGEMMLSAFVDSGNTSLNVMSENLAQQIYGEDYRSQIDNTSYQYDLNTAKQGEKLKVIGRVKRPLPMYIGGYPIPFKTRPLVVAGVTMDFNISGQFLYTNSIDQLHSKGCLLIKGHHVYMQKPHGSHQARVDTSPRRVYADHGLIIPPKKAVQIRILIPSITSGHSAPCQGILHLNSRGKNHSQLVFRTLSLTPNRYGIDALQCYNTGNEPIQITTGMCIGTYVQRRDLETTNGQVVSIENKDIHNIDLIKLFRLDQSIYAKDPEKLKQIVQMLRKHTEAYSLDEEYGKTHLIQHRIITPKDQIPIRLKNRPINPAMVDNLREQVKKWEDDEVIEPSDSPWAFPLLWVPKKNGKIRWCVDYRKLNGITVKDSFPLPNIEDNLAHLSGSTIFSALDLTAAFHCIPIAEKDRPKTAFYALNQLWQYKRMSFGLCNAPASFARLVQKVYSKFPLTKVLTYLDDLLIHDHTFDGHLKTLEKVLQATQDAGLKIQPSKCSLFRKETEYLGHIISNEGIRPIPDYVKVVAEWPEPTTFKALRGFLGKVAYYRKFIPQFGIIAAPLYEKLKKVEENQKTSGNRPVELDGEAKKAFLILRKHLTQAPVLAYPDFKSEDPFILDTDFSRTPGAIGGVLSQKQNGVERVICYGARKLTTAEKNYSSNKGEILAAIHFIRTWRYYLMRRPFILRVDHQAMRWLKTMDPPTGLVGRWIETLSSYDFQVEFRKGKAHSNADSLSRCDHARDPTEEEEMESREETLHSITRQMPRQVSRIIEVPNSISTELFREEQVRDESIKHVRGWIERNEFPIRKDIRHLPEQARQYASIRTELYLNDQQIIVRKPKDSDKELPCVPESMQEPIIQYAHETTGGHMAVANTLARLLRSYYFPGMARKVENYILSCHPCQQKTKKNKAQRHTLVSSPTGTPWMKICLDYVGPMKPSSKGNRYLLTVKDTFTKWVEAIPTNNLSASNLVSLLEKHVFSRHGLPEQIHTDQGTQFTSELLGEVCDMLNIKKTTTPAYNPKSNEVERTHRDLNSILVALTLETGEDWEEVLDIALLALRTAKHSSTGISPFFAMYGREARMPLDFIFPVNNDATPRSHEEAHMLEKKLQLAYQHVRRNIQKGIRRNRQLYRGKLNNQPLQLDDLVWVFTPRIRQTKGKKFSIFWTGPWKITEKISDVLFRVKTHGNWNARDIEFVSSIDRLKRYYENPSVDPEELNLTLDDMTMDDEFGEGTLEGEQGMDGQVPPPIIKLLPGPSNLGAGGHEPPPGGPPGGPGPPPSPPPGPPPKASTPNTSRPPMEFPADIEMGESISESPSPGDEMMTRQRSSDAATFEMEEPEEISDLPDQMIDTSRNELHRARRRQDSIGERPKEISKSPERTGEVPAEKRKHPKGRLSSEDDGKNESSSEDSHKSPTVIEPSFQWDEEYDFPEAMRTGPDELPDPPRNTGTRRKTLDTQPTPATKRERPDQTEEIFPPSERRRKRGTWRDLLKPKIRPGFKEKYEKEQKERERERQQKREEEKIRSEKKELLEQMKRVEKDARKKRKEWDRETDRKIRKKRVEERTRRFYERMLDPDDPLTKRRGPRLTKGDDGKYYRPETPPKLEELKKTKPEPISPRKSPKKRDRDSTLSDQGRINEKINKKEIPVPKGRKRSICEETSASFRQMKRKPSPRESLESSGDISIRTAKTGTGNVSLRSEYTSTRETESSGSGRKDPDYKGPTHIVEHRKRVEKRIVRKPPVDDSSTTGDDRKIPRKTLDRSLTQRRLKRQTKKGHRPKTPDSSE